MSSFTTKSKVYPNEKNRPIFKLDKVAPNNKIIFNAHDAIGDTEATIKLSKILKNKNPNLWHSSLLSTKREDANILLEKEKINCIAETFYGKTIPYIVSLLCYHPVYKTAICFDQNCKIQWALRSVVNFFPSEGLMCEASR